ncbi:MAG: hypothetical protein AB1726_01525 [Planctomycetota bacterium]
MRSRRSRRPVLRTLAALVLLSASGCLVLEQFGGGGDELAFNHEIHVLQEEMECVDCHAGWEERDEPGMPPREDCLLCHGEDAEDTKPVPVADFYDETGAYRTAGVSQLPDEIVFSHRAHATDEKACLDCHADIVESPRIRPWMAPDMDACTACHAESGVAAECATCHAEIRAETAPWTHDGTWRRHHGLSVRDRSELTVDRCDLCHEEAACTSCHAEEPPANHNGFWRRRGHGLAAGIDRENCAACHRQDYCDRCHEEVVPITHRGPWGGTRNTHCYACHLEEGDQGCFLCHDGAPSHSLAPPKPPGHDPASDCRSCHTILLHVDNGDDCNLCHL